jgi:hypothetical protein
MRIYLAPAGLFQREEDNDLFVTDEGSVTNKRE